MQSLDKATVEDMMNLHVDAYNLQAEEFVPILLKQLKSENTRQQLRDIDREALTLIEEWNYKGDKNLGAPLVFHLWMHQFAEVLFIDQIDSSMYKLFDGKAQVVDQLIRQANSGHPGPWIDEKGGLEQVSLLAYQAAIDQIIELQEDDPSTWSWGDFLSVTFAHPLGSINPLHLLFNPKPVPVDGSRVTVGAAGFNSSTGVVNHGAPWRTIVDLSDLSTSYHVVGPGQSGHVLSLWYHDQITGWASGQYHETYLTEKEYTNGHKLILLPH